MDDPRFPAVKVDIVEQKEWESIQRDEITEQAIDAAYEDFSYMSMQDLKIYVDDLSEAKDAKGRKPRRKFTSEEIEWLAEQVEDGNDALEQTKIAIIDAMTWMYETASLPSKSDIIDAVEAAKKSIIENYRIEEGDEGESFLWDPVLALKSRRRGPKEWSPRKRYKERQILENLMDYVHLDWDEEKYGGHIIFDFRNAQVTHDLLSRSAWTAEELIPMLQDEFKHLQRDFMIDFFSALKKEMEDIDISNRTDWRKSWRNMLESGIGPTVQKEMAAALRAMPKEEDQDV